MRRRIRLRTPPTLRCPFDCGALGLVSIPMRKADDEIISVPHYDDVAPCLSLAPPHKLRDQIHVPVIFLI